MPKKGGVITRKDIIEDEALRWGEEYAKQIKVAIQSNKEFIEGLLISAKIYKDLKSVQNNYDFLKSKELERLQFLKNINAIKEQEAAELSALKIKKQTIQALEAERKAREAAENAERKAINAKEKAVKLSIEERIQLEILNKQLKQQALENLGLVGAYDKLNKARTEAKNRLRDLIVAEGENSASVKAAQKEFDALDAKVRQADKAVGDFSKNVGNYPELVEFTNILQNLVGAFGLTLGVDAFIAALGAAYEKIKEFDQAIADLRAITGASGKDLEYLKRQAIEVGKETAGGAVKVVEAYKLIASAKPELLDNVEALNSVTKATLTLSKASGQDLPDAATNLTDALNQFNAPAEKAGEFIDALANGAKFGAAEIPEVTEALLKFGAVARSSNINIQESTALIELLAENGLKGAEAGTALRNVLLKLSAPDALPKEARATFEKLGISMEFLKDKTIPIQQKFEALKPLLKDDSDLVKIFGNENIVAAKNIIGHTDRLKELTKEMYEFGTAEQQAEIRSNTLQGKTETLSATYDSLVLSLNQGTGVVSKFFSFFIDGAKNALEQLIRMNTSWDELYIKAAEKGKESGKSLFDRQFRNLIGSGSDEEISKTIKEVAKRQMMMYQKALEDNLKALEEAESSKYGLRNPFAPSPKDLKKQKEDLIKNIQEQAAIIKQANITILNSKKVFNEEELETEKEFNKLSDEELKKLEKERIDRLKKAYEYRKKLEEDAFRLNQFRLEALIDIEKEFSQDEKEEIDKRLESLYNSYQLKSTLLENQLRYDLKLQGYYNEKTGEFVRDLSDIQIEEIIRTGQTTERLTDEQKLLYEKFEKEKTDITKRESQEREKIINDEVKFLTKKIEADLLSKDNELNAAIEAENLKFKALTEGQKNIAKATEEHERAVFEIKKYYAKQALQVQIDAIQAFLDAEKLKPEETRLSTDQILEYENKLSNYKKQLSEIDLENFTSNNKSKVLSEEEVSEKIKELSLQLKDELVNLANSIFDARIQNIDYEIQKNQEYYDRQIELAGNDQRQKDLLQKEAEKKQEELEKKRRKEQHKQAVFNKVMAGVDIGIKTAQAIMGIWAQVPKFDFGVSAGVMTALVSALGAAQLAAVFATPIPKYKMGRKGGPAELAELGDGYVHEVIEKKDGRAFVTPDKPTLMWLDEGDKVYKSIDDYHATMRAANMASLSSESNKLNSFEASLVFDHSYDKEMIKEIKLLRKATEKSKAPVYKAPDINHYLWKSNNTKWN